MSAKKIDRGSFYLGKAVMKITRLIQSPMNLHYHEFDELVLVGKGKGIHFTEKEEQLAVSAV